MRTYLISAATASALACFAADDAAASGSKSIVDPKYRTKKEPDWLAKLIAEKATIFEDKTKQVKDGEETKTVTSKVAVGVDVDALFRLAEVNGLDVAKFEAQKGTHGFEGRFRMSLRNMLDAATRRRHGLFVPRGQTRLWVEADADWLKSGKGSPEKPTHDRDGKAFPKPKADKAAEPAKEDAPA